MSPESESLFTLKADFSHSHTLLLCPMSCCHLDNCPGQNTSKLATKFNTQGANTGFIIPQQVEGVEGGQEGTVNRGKSWTGGPF